MDQMSSEEDIVSTSSGENGSSTEEDSRPNRRRLQIDFDVKWHDSEKKERSKVEYEGKLYRFDAPSKKVDEDELPLYNFYKCDQKRCSGRLWIVRATSKLRFEIGKHTCEDQSWRVGNADVRDKQNALIRANVDTPGSQVVQQSMERLSNVQKLHTPCRKSMIQRANKQRRKYLNLPAEPKDFRFEAIPDTLKNFADGSLFLLYDSGPLDAKRMVVWGDSMFDVQHVVAVFGDGTFASCALQHRKGYKKKMFSQLFVLMGERERIVHPEGGEPYVHCVSFPFIHAQLPAKDEETYQRLFKKVIELFPLLRPTLYKGDYEKAPMNAVKAVWPGIKTEGDSFHLHQALCIKQVSINKDKQLYKTNVHFHYQVRLLLTPMYAPQQYRSSLFHNHLKPMLLQADNVAEFPKIPRYVEYIENNFIGIIGKNGTPDTRPLFSFSVADMYTSTMEKRPRDNNTMESNNKKLKRLLGSNPGEWWMARHLRAAYDGDYRVQYLQFVAGHVEPRSAKSVRTDKRILAQVQQFAQVIAGRKTMIEWANGMVAAF